MLKAFDENWTSASYAAQLKAEERRKELLRKQEEQRRRGRLLTDLALQHGAFKFAKAHSIYAGLPEKFKIMLDNQFKPWLEEKYKKAGQFKLKEEFYRNIFLAQELLDTQDLNFIQWTAIQGHILEPHGKQYRFKE
ncbi:MAG: hypothetical protein H0T84_14770 [Tatlockia sp.]|nr:hypothetical protein [Tatlockia sp.]